jgi:choline dehydrogenase-like flavoprotein
MMAYDFDVIVTGSGAGGGTFSYACARAGKRVLLLERGEDYPCKDQTHDERAMLIDKKPFDNRPVRWNGHSLRLYVGGVLGGSTALYGAALMRPSEDDFHPGRHYGDRIPRAIWDWPITSEDLEPHFTEAEALFEVSGSSEDDFGPLQKPRQGFPLPSIPVKPINRQLMSANQARGLKPFRLPLAIDFSRCLQCGSCPGYVCPTGARRSTTHLAERARAAGFPLQVLTNAEVEAFATDARGYVSGVSVRDRSTGRRSIYRAARYALAAGAIGSPALLLRSRLGGPLVGRHYMTHLSPVVVGIFRQRIGAESTYVKQVGFSDYYFGTRRYAHKLGLVQSIPVPGPLLLAKATCGRLPRSLIQCLRQRMLPLAGIVEDLPDPSNRVYVRSDGGHGVRHRFAPYDFDRGRRLGRLIGQILKNAGAAFCLYKSFPSEEHVAHQCGTLRFGKDPASAVVDADCRLFGQPNMFVVDGSIFPTSLGVGPALTIMANALRVARVAVRET